MESENLSDAFLRLVNIMDELREKCPWDRKQTIHTLRTLSIEELYELTDAIISEDWPGIKEELGDLFLHLLFYARIAQGAKSFSAWWKCLMESVINSLPVILIFTETLIVNSEEDVKQNWEKLKLKEGKKSVLSGVPVSLPAVVKSIRLQEKSKQVGFRMEQYPGRFGRKWKKKKESCRKPF